MAPKNIKKSLKRASEASSSSTSSAINRYETKIKTY